jgi:hypothetical protein
MTDLLAFAPRGITPSLPRTGGGGFGGGGPYRSGSRSAADGSKVRGSVETPPDLLIALIVQHAFFSRFSSYPISRRTNKAKRSRKSVLTH